MLAFARFDVGGKRGRSIHLLAIRESSAHERILMNEFRFWYPGMVPILDHYPVAIDPSVGPSWESDIYMLPIEGSTISSMGWGNWNFSKESI